MSKILIKQERQISSQGLMVHSTDGVMVTCFFLPSRSLAREAVQNKVVSNQ